jgi:O-antigen ligase
MNMLTDAFAEKSETEGSSIQLRISQFIHVLSYTKGHELLGLGHGYWAYNLTEDLESIEGLFGIESVILQYLLERGYIGLILWALFYAILFRYFWKNRKKVRTLTGLGASILTAYLIF